MAETGMRTWVRAAAMVLPMFLLAGCAATPDSDADQANLASCTQAADAQYQANNLDSEARTSQNGLYFAPTPNHVFDAQQMGSLDARNNQIKNCVENGNPDQPALAGTPAQTAALPRPQIIGTQNQ